MSRLFDIRDELIASIDASGTDLIEVIGWRSPSHLELQHADPYPLTAKVFEAELFTIGSRADLLMQLRGPELAIFLAVSAVMTRPLICDFQITPGSLFGPHRFRTPAKAADTTRRVFQDRMSRQDVDRWRRTVMESQSHHGQLALAARLSIPA